MQSKTWFRPALVATLIAGGVAVDGAPAQSSSPPAPPAKVGTAAAKLPAFGPAFAQAKVDAILDTVIAGGPLSTALSDLETLFAQAIVYRGDDKPDTLRVIAIPRRWVSHLSRAQHQSPAEMLKFLRANPNFGANLALLDGTGTNTLAPVYTLADRLRAERGDQVEKYATLAAAICLVHYKPLERRVNENKPAAIDPIALFDYYAKNEKKMLFGIRNVPTELLVYVVDATGSIDELTWAMNKYAGDTNVGKRFFDIAYEHDAFRKGTPKKVNAHGFTLPNILQYGGVCADQAYFAMSVGKAIGVPTAYASGASGNGRHAWVGFLQAQGKRGGWNFESGRYEAYKNVRGMVLNPHTREHEPDSHVSLLSELIDTKPVDRQNAMALTDAAAHLLTLANNKRDAVEAPSADEVSAASVRPKPRAVDLATALTLLEQALKESPATSAAWFQVRDLAKEGKLALADKRRWADTLLKLGSVKYPDFTLAVIAPMIETVEDVKEQDKLWSAVFDIFQRRADLAADIRLRQAKNWADHNEPSKAGRCYMDVIERFADAGPFVMPALEAAEKALIDAGRPQMVVTLFEQTWKRTQLPKSRTEQFLSQTNWYKVGSAYAKRLEEAGDATKAKSVRDELKSRVGDITDAG